MKTSRVLGPSYPLQQGAECLTHSDTSEAVQHNCECKSVPGVSCHEVPKAAKSLRFHIHCRVVVAVVGVVDDAGELERGTCQQKERPA
jgi:hypothetical protein